MKDDKRSEYVTRDTILKLLPDDEVASVSATERASQLANGDEYLDLEQLNRGVQQASETTATMGRVLSRSAVHERTWNTILAHLAAPSGGMAHIGASAALADQKEMHRSGRVGWLRAAVLGSDDAIVSTASLMIGVAAASASNEAVLVAGVAGLVAGAMSMAVGEYVSVSSQRDAEPR